MGGMGGEGRREGGEEGGWTFSQILTTINDRTNILTSE
jgi:hypothetical protein